LTITSPAFAHQAAIPIRYTCDGEDLSPPLEWSDPPPGTESLALVADDPDAPRGTWVHWVIYNIPAQARGLPEALPADLELADGSVQGRNSWPKTGYGGPCPPSGTHRYYFKLYALDTMLDLESGESKKSLLQAMKGHILAEAQLLGTYARK
jgi:Raf kinase inhibitor-like YbhB/YbcL family protein